MERNLIDKFPPEFREFLYKSAITGSIYQYLEATNDPYAAIFELCKSYEKLYKSFHEAISMMPPKPIITDGKQISYEMYATLLSRRIKVDANNSNWNRFKLKLSFLWKLWNEQ